MTKRIFLSALLALALGNGVARADAPAENAEQSVLDSITALRAEQHLPPLTRDADLDEAALIHAEDMAAHDFVGHVSDRTGDPAARARAVGARVRRVGENVARAESTAAAVASLASSDAHRAQILSGDYTTVGIAVVEDDEGFYVVEVFGAPLAAPTATAVAPALPPPVVADLPAPAPVAPTPAALPGPVAPTSTSLEDALRAAVVAADPSATVTTTDCGADCPDSEVEGVDTVVRTTPSSVAAAEPIAPAPVQLPNQTSVQYPQQQAAQNGAQAAYAPASTTTAGAPIVILQGAAPRNVAGYWVQAGGRWWYYPIPANARPGQTLTPSTSAPAAPNTVPAQPTLQPYTQPYAQPYAQPPVQRRGFFRPSPRRW